MFRYPEMELKEAHKGNSCPNACILGAIKVLGTVIGELTKPLPPEEEALLDGMIKLSGRRG
jgi:hypothetical protein